MSLNANPQERLATILQQKFQVAPEKITSEARLRDDLGLDSIDLFDLMVMFEEETGKSLSADDYRTVVTVKDLLALLSQSAEKAA